MDRRAHDPFAVAVLAAALLAVTLGLFLLASAVRRQAEARPGNSSAPPGWTGPTSPPPSPERGIGTATDAGKAP